ncbi:YnfU family zinc-binding protein [Microvirga lupini]|uniref:YnfU family zinc-binding protein n=1 Tax=Microvirga lupini TaxID=420324 RepID=UPI003CCE0FDE
MPKLSDEITFPIGCPKCGHETEQTVTRLKDEPELTCPACGERFKVESRGSAGDVADELDKIDRLFDKF